MQLILVRHARPLHVETDDGSPADPPLADIGHAQARAVGGWLAEEPIDAIHTSPMQRARETAAPLCSLLTMEPIVTDGIAEYDRDAASYMPMDQLKEENYEAWLAMMQGDNNMGLDDPVGFQRIVVEAIEGIIGAHGGQTVAAFCHGMVINSYLAHILDRTPGDVFFLDPAYTGMSRIMASSKGDRSLLSFNEVPHLRSGI